MIYSCDWLNAVHKLGQRRSIVLNCFVASRQLPGRHKECWDESAFFDYYYLLLFVACSWLRKESYGNSFFALDVSNSFIDVKLKSIVELTMTEYHVDRLVQNLQKMNVHIRVGAKDLTTHPWFSRSLHRILIHNRINSTLDEVCMCWSEACCECDCDVGDVEYVMKLCVGCWEGTLVVG